MSWFKHMCAYVVDNVILLKAGKVFCGIVFMQETNVKKCSILFCSKKWVNCKKLGKFLKCENILK